MKILESNKKLETSAIWQAYKDSLTGEETGKTTYRSNEFGEMSQKLLTELLMQQFKARRPKYNANHKELIFDKTVLDNMRQKYRIKLGTSLDADESDDADISLDAHMSEESTDNKSSKNAVGNDKNSSKNEQTDTNHIQQSDDEAANDHNNPTQATQATQDNSNRSSNDPEAYWNHGKWRENMQ